MNPSKSTERNGIPAKYIKMSASVIAPVLTNIFNACISFNRIFSKRVKNHRTEVESRTQGSRPRPRTQKKSEAKAKDSLCEDRHSRGQGQECSRPRPRTKDTSASALQKKKKVFTKIFQAISKKKKRSSQKFFKRSLQKSVFQKIFQALH